MSRSEMRSQTEKPTSKSKAKKAEYLEKQSTRQTEASASASRP